MAFCRSANSVGGVSVASPCRCRRSTRWGTCTDSARSPPQFARLLDELHLPQPQWWLPGGWPDHPPPSFWVKAAFSTAGAGVRHAHSRVQGEEFAEALGTDGMPVLFQAAAPGEYGQVQSLFDHGRMVAAHTCVGTGIGVGGSAAARLSVDHPEARDAARMIGAALEWHGGLTLDYLHVDGHPQIIECNPRTVEPGTAAASGVNLPLLTLAIIRGEPLPQRCLIGTPGVRSHSSLALALGAAATSRRAAVRAPPLGVTLARILANPRSTTRIAAAAVSQYAVTPDLIGCVRKTAQRPS